MKFNILGWQATIWDIITAILFWRHKTNIRNLIDKKEDKIGKAKN